jgi:hypothetical protein
LFFSATNSKKVKVYCLSKLNEDAVLGGLNGGSASTPFKRDPVIPDIEFSSFIGGIRVITSKVSELFLAVVKGKWQCSKRYLANGPRKRRHFHGNAIVAGLFCIASCRKYGNLTKKVI